MLTLPIAHWQDSLDQMEAALASAAQTLAGAEERWELAVAAPAGEPHLAFDRLEARLREWEAHLQAAENLTASVEVELAERMAAVEQWRDARRELGEPDKNGRGFGGTHGAPPIK